MSFRLPPASIRLRKPIEEGTCASCKKRRGKSRVVAGSAGSPILCETCYELRRARVKAKQAKALTPYYFQWARRNDA